MPDRENRKIAQPISQHLVKSTLVGATNGVAIKMPANGHAACLLFKVVCYCKGAARSEAQRNLAIV